jgi:hypothetical protein
MSKHCTIKMYYRVEVKLLRFSVLAAEGNGWLFPYFGFSAHRTESRIPVA